MISLLDPDGEDFNQEYAKLLGGFLSDTNQALDVNFLKSLNQGRAPAKLLSSSDMATLDASGQQYYANMLRGFGIISSDEDLRSQQQRFAPATFI